jgi:hypothetical protein
MFLKKTFLCTAMLLGVFFVAQPARSYVIPIVSTEENAMPNLMLLIESEITRWQQEALKYQEMLYTDLIGKVGGGSLGQNNVITQMQDAAKDAAGAIGNTTAKLEFVPNLSNYATAKEQIENYYLVRPEYGRFYTTDDIRNIQENQRVALNDLAVSAITQASVNMVQSAVEKSDSEPKQRANDISKAKDVNGMLEMLLAMDRKAYERSLQISALEATDAGVQAMLVLKGISQTGQYVSGSVEE